MIKNKLIETFFNDIILRGIWIDPVQLGSSVRNVQIGPILGR